MRISTAFSQQLGINSILNKQVEQSKTQLQLGTGLRILTPSDDPAASTKVIDLQQSIDQIRQYKRNIETAESRLGLEDSTLDNVGNALQRVRELAVQGLNDSNSPSDRQAIAIEIRQINDQLLSLANSKTANGEFMFSGYRSNTAPYSSTVQQVTQGGITKEIYTFEFQGDENQREIQISETQRIADGDHGVTVFGRSFDYLGNPPSTINPSNPTEGSIFDMVAELARQLETDNLDPSKITESGVGMGTPKIGSLIDSALLQSAIADQTVTVTAPDGTTQNHIINSDSARSAQDLGFNLNTLNGITVQPNPNRVDLDVTGTTNITDGDVVSFVLHADPGTNTPVSFVRDSVTYPALEADFAAAINAAGLGDLSAAVSASNEFSISSPSGANIGIENFTVADAASQVQSITFDGTSLTEGSATDSALKTSTVTIALSDGYSIASNVSGTQASGTFGVLNANAGIQLVSDTAILDDLDAGLQRVLTARASIGARMNALDLQQELSDDFVLEMQTVLSDTRDLDFTEAISRFNLQLVGLQAAQQAYSRVQGLSLFNFL